MSTFTIVMIVILVILIGVLVGLYIFGKKAAQIPADCLDMAAFALFYTDPRICYVFDHRTGFPQEQDV